MTRFASLLKIPHEVMTSDESLMEGETEGIAGWEDYLQVPDRSREIARRREEEDEVNERKLRLQEEGVLLVDRTGEPPGGSICHPIACPDRDAATTSWHASMPVSAEGQSRSSGSVRTGPPGAVATGLSLDSRASMLVPSPSGRFLAIGGGILGWGTAIGDRDGGRLVRGGDSGGRVLPDRYPARRNCRLGVSKDGVVSVPLAGGEPTTWEIEGGRHAAIHPSGTVLVVALDHNRLLLLDLKSGRVIDEWLVGGLSQVAGFAAMARLCPDFAEKVREVTSRYDLPGFSGPCRV